MCFYKANAAIVLNSLFVGVEMQVGMNRALDGMDSTEDPTIEIGNHLFAAIFAIELICRVAAFRIHFFLGQDWYCKKYVMEQ